MRTRYVDIDDRMEDLADRMRAAPDLAADFLQKYELSWLYHENALEGVVYTPQELATALANQPLADATFVSALTALRNHKTALDLAREEAKAKRPKLTVALVKRLNETLCGGPEKTPPDFRKDMPLHRAYFHEIAQPAKIPALLEKVLEATESPEFRHLHPVQQIARLQHGFMQVFPYTDQSGRIARLLANLLLVHAGYPLLLIVHSTDRQRYYESLRLTESSLRDLSIEALDNALTQAEKHFAGASMRTRKAAR
ncbi:Fic family protein [Anaeromyxobacter sp. Fw109-5]|uniref:Fic family protein n=1 Tax=Anaeromyxobacter sp. (strain Fw109-5) TaxID=404589 RepID=UPI0000ED802D|nr:Fic family protein [Anaeromyxobacter sp. Fw109-5]ABS25309.1 filamentation induced by cAMP protein Fic [Anaeromyxobacter sp. Fw109-5]